MAVVVISLFLVSAFIPPLQKQEANGETTEIIDDVTENVNAEITNSLSLATETGWTLGYSVRVEQEFPKTYILPETVHYSILSVNDSSWLPDYRALPDQAGMWDAYCDTGTSELDTIVSFQFEAVSAGDLSLMAAWKIGDTASAVEANTSRGSIGTNVSPSGVSVIPKRLNNICIIPRMKLL